MTDNKNNYSFSGFILDPAQRELRYRDSVRDIEPRAFDLLVYLVQNRDRAVDKNELQDAVWPGMVVTETALTRAVMKARKAVGDDAGRQQVIKTLHGHGYRFVADCSVTGAASDSDGAATLRPDLEATSGYTESEPQPDQASPVALQHEVKPWGLFAVVFVSFFMLLVWFFTRPGDIEPEGVTLAVMPLLNETGDDELIWSSLGLMSYVAKLVAEDQALQVVPNGNIVSLVENLGWTGDLNDPANTEILEKLTEVFGVTHVLTMELQSDKRALRMNYALSGPDDVLQGTMVGDEGTELAEGVAQVAYGALLKKSRKTDSSLLVSADPFNNEAYARGMAMSLQGRCAEAVPFFRLIIEQEPELFAPRYEYAACQRILGEAEEAEQILLELVGEQRALGPSSNLARALMTLGVLYNRTGRLTEARASHEEALGVAQQGTNSDLEGRILQNLSIVTKDEGDLEGAEQLLDRAVLVYREADRAVLPGHLWSGRANIGMARGELVEADADLKRALEAFREVGDRRNEAMMLNNTGYLRRRQGRLDEAEDYHLRSLEIREEIGDRVGVGRIWGMLGVVYTARGQYEDAVEAATQAHQVALETNDRLFEGTSLAQLADAERALGELDSAREHYQMSREVFIAIQDQMRTLQAELKLADLDIRTGNPAQAETIALSVLDRARALDAMQPEVQALEMLGDIRLTETEHEEAIGEYLSAMAVLRNSTWASKINTLNRKLANAYMDINDIESAEPLIGALAGDEPNVQSLKAQARLAFMQSNESSAVKMMEQAKALAGDLWAAESEAQLQAYLAATGSP